MRVSVAITILLGLVCQINGGGQMPQAMFDEMKGAFFKFMDGNFPKAKEGIVAALKPLAASSEKEIKLALKDAKSSAGMASPAALVGQFVSPAGLAIGQFPGRCMEGLASFAEFYTANQEQLKKLPPFKMGDTRAPALMDEFKKKFEGYVAELAQVVNANFEDFLHLADAVKKEFEPVLKKSIGGRDGDFFGDLNQQWGQAVKDARADMQTKINEYKQNLIV